MVSTASPVSVGVVTRDLCAKVRPSEITDYYTCTSVLVYRQKDDENPCTGEIRSCNIGSPYIKSEIGIWELWNRKAFGNRSYSRHAIGTSEESPNFRPRSLFVPDLTLSDRRLINTPKNN